MTVSPSVEGPGPCGAVNVGPGGGAGDSDRLGSAMKVCLRCGGAVAKGRRKYCGKECAYLYWRETVAVLWWGIASGAAAKRANHQCESCYDRHFLEVHHIIPLAPGERRHNSPKNRQDNLIVLCRGCHELAHHSPHSEWPRKGKH